MYHEVMLCTCTCKFPQVTAKVPYVKARGSKMTLLYLCMDMSSKRVLIHFLCQKTGFTQYKRTIIYKTNPFNFFAACLMVIKRSQGEEAVLINNLFVEILSTETRTRLPADSTNKPIWLLFLSMLFQPNAKENVTKENVTTKT